MTLIGAIAPGAAGFCNATQLAASWATSRTWAAAGETGSAAPAAAGLVDYLYVYGCVLGGSPVLGGAFLALALLFLFVALAATAQHFFCPNLSSIATFLEMPESVSGVTIAALGNGAGDLFATFAAFKAGLVPLALGELFGAATFITCCVAGLVCIVKPSKLPRRSFLRDTIAFLGAAALVNAFVASGELSISKSLALIGYYIVYVIVVVVGAFMSQQSLHAAPSEAVVPERSPFLPRVLFGEEQAAGPAAGSAVAPSPLASAFGAMRSSSSEFMASNVSLVNETDFDTDFFLPHLKLSSSRKSPLYRGRSGALFIPPDASSLVQMRGNDPLFDDSPGVITPLRPSAPLVVTPEPGPVAAARVLRMPSIEEEILAYAPLRRPEHAEIYESLVEPILRRALPVVFKWQSMTLLHRLQAVLAAPVVALLTLAAPVVHEQQFDRADSNEGYERVPAWPADEPAGIVSAAASGRMLGPGPVSSPDVGGFPDLLVEDEATVYSDPDEEIISALTFLQVLVAPLVTCVFFQVQSNLIEFGPTYKPYVPPGQPASPLPNRPGGAVSMMAMPVWVVALAAGAALAPAVCFVILPRLSTRTQLKALSVFGFLISMMFVATFSSELVVLLDAIGTLSGMSQTLLLVTNVSIARMGYPTMAIGACYGGPMLNIVVGIGFSSLYVTLTTAKPIAVAGMDAVFWISSAGLYIGLVSTLVYVVRNKFQVGEKLGAALLACYGVLIGLVVVYSSAAAVVCLVAGMSERSHWDRLPLELKDDIVRRAGLFTQWTAGRIDAGDLAGLDDEAAWEVWRDAIACEWAGDLGELPECAWLPPELFWGVRLRGFYERLRALGHEGMVTGLQHAAARNGLLGARMRLPGRRRRRSAPASAAAAAESGGIVLVNGGHNADDDSDGDGGLESSRLGLSNAQDVAEVAAAAGVVGLLADLVEGQRAARLAPNLAELAAFYGHMDVLEWLHARMPDGEWTTQAMDNAAWRGHQRILEFLHTHRTEGCTAEAMDDAARNGHLATVRWLHANRTEGCTTEAMDNAAWQGHLAIVRFLHEHRAEGCTTRAMELAAASGHLDVVRWLHAHRSEGCTPATIRLAARNGHMEVVRWLHEHRSECSVQSVLEMACAAGMADCAAWLLRRMGRGVAWDFGAALADDYVRSAQFLPMGDHVAFLRSLPLLDLVVVLFRMLVMLGQIAAAVVAVVMSRDSQLQLPESINVVGSAIIMVFVILLVPRYFQLGHRTNGDPELIELETRRRQTINTLDLPFVICLMAGLIACISPKDTVHTAPFIYYTNLAFVVLSCMYFGAPILLFALAILSLPLLYLLLRRAEARNNVFDGRMGASDDIIGAIPIVRYRRKPAPDPETGEHPADAAGAAPAAADAAQAAQPNPPTADAPAQPRSDGAVHPEPDSSATAAAAATASPAAGAAAQSAANPSSRQQRRRRGRRRFNLIPSIFRRNKAAASAAGESSSAAPAADVENPPQQPTELELDEEDAVCCI
ncbi:hypothetical protein HK105_209446, partial [Polyrhizophydium stewartii]